MKQELIDYIKVIEGMLFYYEVIESIPFSTIESDIELNFISNIIGIKMENILGKEMWNEYLTAVSIV